MPWIQILFHTNNQLAQQLSQLLSENGAQSVTFQDDENQPLLEPGVGETPLWDAVIVTGLFNELADPQLVLHQISSALYPASIPDFEISTLEDKVWEREWMKHFHAMRFGKRTWICPSGDSVSDRDAAVIMLDPGLAFGTGTHPTTALCLQWLDACIQGGEDVIDFGCGSGILGIAALKLGASRVWAVDNDPQALLATRNNAAANGVDTYIQVCDTAQPLKIQADLLIANILANPLISLSSYLSSLVKPAGMAVLSGILAEQQDGVIAAYEPHFYVYSRAQQDEWMRLDLKRR